MSDHIHEKLSRGQWVAVYPYGYYLKIKNRIHTVEVDTQKKKVVQELYRLYLTESYSLSMLAQYIQDTYSLPLYKARIENILKNKFYHGIMAVRGKEYQHEYEKMVTKEDYDAVQSIMRNRGRGGRWKPKVER